ncbi:omptin family outer membrane protease [Rosenbergiella metrosideri]|uniref:omptin family outer membrane protease n=1 Tax=Rosenbergiella metrosideri TaxID=2921185 RepID=UPI001F501AC3
MYRQTYKTPYFGLLVSDRYQQWQVGGEVRYSAWGRAADVDDDHNADATYTLLVTQQKSTSLSLNGEYYFTENTKAYLEGTWRHTFNRKGMSHDREEDISGSSKNSADIENTPLLTSLGLGNSF